MPLLSTLTSRQLAGIAVKAPAPVLVAQYTGFSLDNTTYSEGATLTALITTTNIPNGTTVGYTVTGISASDLSSGSLTGNITIVSNSGSVSFTMNNDGLTEGPDTFTITLAATDSLGNSTGSLSDSATVNDTSNDPATTLWLGTNDQPTTVRLVIGATSMQINGVFSSSPSVPVSIQGRNSGTITTITAVTANTGTFIEVDDTGNSTGFIIGEQLNRFALTAYNNTSFATGNTFWVNVSLRITTTSNNSLATALRPLTAGRKIWINYGTNNFSVLTLQNSFTESSPDPGTGTIQFVAGVTSSTFSPVTPTSIIILPAGS